MTPEIREPPFEHRFHTSFAALLDQLEALAQRQPVLLVVEDVHWADPTHRIMSEDLPD